MSPFKLAPYTVLGVGLTIFMLMLNLTIPAGSIARQEYLLLITPFTIIVLAICAVCDICFWLSEIHTLLKRY